MLKYITGMMGMMKHWDEDMEFCVYSIADIKSELGLAPHTRGGIFEKTLVKLEEDNQLMVLCWILHDEDKKLVEYRMLTPSDSIRIVVEFFKALPEKKQKKIYERANNLVFSIALWNDYFDNNKLWSTIWKRQE